MFSTRDILGFDAAMQARPENGQGICWYLPFEEPMAVAGFGWLSDNKKYNRLPLKNRPAFVTQYPMGKVIRIPAEKCGALKLADNTAGGQVRFRTNSTRFLLQGKVGNSQRWDHMPLTCSEGFDIYLRDGDIWNFYGVTRYDHSTQDFSVTLCEKLKREMREVIIDFPLYNGVESLAVGLDADAVVEKPAPFAAPRPIVFYGTSITQGGCASRPGMTSSNILSRMLNMEFINLGFSDSGRGEPEIAKMLAAIQNPALYIIDYSGNVGAETLQATLPSVLDTIRAAHPQVPFLVTSDTLHRSSLPSYAEPGDQQARADVMRREVQRRNQLGEQNVYFFDVLREALGPDPVECTVDGAHLTDLGFLRYSTAILPHIRRILGMMK